MGGNTHLARKQKGALAAQFVSNCHTESRRNAIRLQIEKKGKSVPLRVIPMVECHQYILGKNVTNILIVEIGGEGCILYIINYKHTYGRIT